MKCLNHLALALVLALGFAPIASAQTATGNVYGTVVDQSGAVLPGATVDLSGEIGTRSTVTGTQGNFRFLALPSGPYTLTVSMSGFASVSRALRVTTAENVNLTFTLGVASVEETLLVTAETPLVDVKKRGTNTTMTKEELHQVPNARDPWGVLKAVPGVMIDRMNIAGNENGQQANFAGKGTTRTDSNFNLDGITITDMSATGASPGYYDLGAFEEIAVTTGAADLSVGSGGIGINMVTKRGTNTWHGSARYLLSHRDLSFSNLPDELANDPRLENADGSRRDKADHINQISDYGFSLGGPIVKDRLWFNVSWGKQDIRLTRLVGTADRTILPTWNGKINWQVGSSTMISGTYFDNNKQKFGRESGIPLQKEDSFLWNQASATEDQVGGPDRPPGLFKLQVDHTFSANFFLSANVAYFNTGFGLLPRGGDGQSFTADYVNGIATGSYSDYLAVRPQHHANINGNYFFEGMGGNHELKFGFGYRKMKTTSGTHYGGDQLSGFIYAEDDYEAWVTRDRKVDYGGEYISLYAGDVFTKDRFTLNVGLRWDGQTAKNNASEAPANAAFPDRLPALSFGGNDSNVIDWSTVSPRLGFSYALDESNRTVLRGSYAWYARHLSFGWVSTENPAGLSILAYGWNDTNGDRVVQAGEVNFDDFHFNFGVDPNNPGAVGTTSSQVDRELKPRRDHEVVLGIDREVAPSFAVGAAYTFRKTNDFMADLRMGGRCSGDPLVSCASIIQPDEYIANDPVTANGYTAFTYSPPNDRVNAGLGGRLRTNAPGYSRTFNGIELTATKRLSAGWMGRLGFSWQRWTENWDGAPYSVSVDEGNPTPTEFDPLQQGGPVTLLSGGSGKASFYSNHDWQLYANGLVELPWDLDVSGALFARQGGIYPVSLLLSGGRDGTNRALAVSSVDDLRYDTNVNLDLRLAKTIRFGRASFVLTAEWFNVFNSSTVLSRYRFANSSRFTDTAGGAEAGRGRIEEVISPSIFRLGARITF